MGPVDVRWGGIAITVLAALILGGASGAAGRHYLNSRVAPPLPAVTRVQAQPIPTVGPGTEVTPAALPDHILLQVPFTTQAPLNDWAKHQESCEAANLTMLLLYWGHDQSVVIDPHAADSYIKQIDSWKSQPDLNDSMLGQLAEQHYGYSYRILPNDPKVIAQQLSAGRPPLAGGRAPRPGDPPAPRLPEHHQPNSDPPSPFPADHRL